MHKFSDMLIKGKKLALDDIRELLYARKFSVDPELLKAEGITSAIECMTNRWGIGQPVDDDEQPVFIFSAGWRSGSTLLQRLVFSSKEVVIWGEPLGNAGSIARLSLSLEAINEIWPPDNYFANHPVYADPCNEWLANMAPPVEHLIQAHREFMTKWLGEPALKYFGVKRWGIKEVRLTIHHAIYLKWLFPRAKFVFICRNPLDSYRSWKGNRWRDKWPSYYRLSPIAFSKHWRLLTNGFVRDADKVNAMVIKFEDLLGGQLELGKLADHLEVSRLDERILERKVRGPEQLSRLRNSKLTLFDRIVIRHVCGPLMRELGYGL